MKSKLNAILSDPEVKKNGDLFYPAYNLNNRLIKLSSELNSLEKLEDNIILFKGDPVKKFFKFMSPEEQAITKKEHEERFKKVTEKAIDENFDLLIMDEIIASINLGLISLDEVVEFLKNKPKTLEVVLTGRGPDEKLVELADYVSEIKAIKHPYERGISSRIGIEK